MKLKPLAASIALGASALLAAPAYAQGGPGTAWGTYLGASVGDSDLDTALKVYVGSSVTPNFGWEATYIDFGSLTRGNATTDAWGLGMSLVGVLPLNAGFSAFGKLGAYYVKSEVRGPVFRTSGSDVELGAGIGLRYAFNPQFALRLELESIGGEGGDVISVGVQARF